MKIFWSNFLFPAYVWAHMFLWHHVLNFVKKLSVWSLYGIPRKTPWKTYWKYKKSIFLDFFVTSDRKCILSLKRHKHVWSDVRVISRKCVWWRIGSTVRYESTKLWTQNSSPSRCRPWWKSCDRFPLHNIVLIVLAPTFYSLHYLQRGPQNKVLAACDMAVFRWTGSASVSSII